jgi:hypothetical protein
VSIYLKRNGKIEDFFSLALTPALKESCASLFAFASFHILER